MNFIKAVQHATIGYAIRRRAWGNPDSMLILDHTGEFRWVAPNCMTVAALLGSDTTGDLTAEDIIGTDWEAV